MVLTTRKKIENAIDKALDSDYPKVELYRMARVIAQRIDELKEEPGMLESFVVRANTMKQ